MNKFRKIVSSMLAAGVFLSSSIFTGGLVVNADTVAINENSFPDNAFRRYVTQFVDTNYDGNLSQEEAEAVKTLLLNDYYWSGWSVINDLTGLEYFTNLEELNCRGNNLSELDVSKNTKLTILECWDNNLTELDVSSNIELELLSIEDNNITSLDVSKNNKLIQLWCSNNLLAKLDVTNNPDLEKLFCSNNQLTELDLSNSKKLTNLTCTENQIAYLDFSTCEALKYVECQMNGLEKIDLSNCTRIEILTCYDNNLTSLDLSDCVNIRVISISGNLFKEVDFSNNPILLSILDVPFNTFTDLEGREYLNMDTNLENGYWAGIRIDPDLKIITDNANNEPPTSTPTVGPIPTVVPTSAPAQSAGNFVDRCYSVALNRKADEEGFDYWLDSLNNGKICGAQAGYGFIFSDEYINKETTNEEFVTDLYSMYFGRTPDEGGFNYWVGLLNSGATREEIFAGFANSSEFDNLCGEYGVVTGTYIVGVPNEQQGGVNSFVARLYQVCLNRLPDMGGQTGWVTKLLNGELTGTSCAHGFVFSPEFIGNEPSNEEFVACMYRAFFGREPDIDGFTAWVQRLNEGSTYEEVFDGFSGSAEFANLCAGYGINP